MPRLFEVTITAPGVLRIAGMAREGSYRFAALTHPRAYLPFKVPKNTGTGEQQPGV